MRPLPLLLCAAVLAPAALPAAEFDQTKLGQIRPRMQQFVDEGAIAGAVVAVGNSRGVAYLEAVGSLRLDPARTMPKNTLFRIASMTKPITATGIQLLAEDGKLNVNDPVEKYLPEFKGQLLVEARKGDRLILKKPARPITLADLLTHTSGLPGGYPPGLGNVYGKRNFSLAETTLVIAQRPLEFEPGSRWAYCNAGIDTLGRVIEVVSGESYEAFLRRRIFDPLGMTDTVVAPQGEQAKRIVELTTVKNGKLVPEANPLIGPAKSTSHPIPAGGLYSTAADMARFYRMMLNNGSLEGKKVLSSASVKALTTVHTGDLKCGFTDGMGFGYGFAVVRKPEGVTAMLSPGTFGHGGAFGTQSWADPKQDLFVILMIQLLRHPQRRRQPDAP
ncbi:MAG: serine hydrolase domain-containing protein [Gemmataceae bacterium]